MGSWLSIIQIHINAVFDYLSPILPKEAVREGVFCILSSFDNIRGERLIAPPRMFSYDSDNQAANYIKLMTLSIYKGLWMMK